MSDKVALVTGGAGFIGSHIVDALVGEGWSVAIIDDMSSGSSANVNPDVELYEVDICDEGLVDVVREISPDTVFHLAAQKSPSLSTREPLVDARINVMGTLNLLEALRAEALPKFVFASTGGAIYGEPESNPVSEAVIPRPESPYAAAKLACEAYLSVYEATYGFSTTILRLGNVYGPRQDPLGEAGAVAIFSRAMLSGDPVKIFGDGQDERDYVYVSDVVGAFMTAAKSGGSGPYNIGSGVGISVNSLVEELTMLTEWRGEPEFLPSRPGDIHKVSLNAERAGRELGWAPSVGFADGLIQTVAYFRD